MIAMNQKKTRIQRGLFWNFRSLSALCCLVVCFHSFSSQLISALDGNGFFDGYQESLEYVTSLNALFPLNSTERKETTIPPYNVSWCSSSMMKYINTSLPNKKKHCSNSDAPWINKCSITLATGCPETTWMDDYYNRKAMLTTKDETFVAINVGCNKGFDAVNMLRMGTKDPSVSRALWKSFLPSSISGGVCAQENEDSQYQITTDGPLRQARVLCVEPFPATFHALSKALNETGYHKKGFQLLQYAVNNEDPGYISFPKSTDSKVVAGDEKASIDKGGKCLDCDSVPTTRLDTLIQQEGLGHGTIIDHMLIDVEGWDFEVLKGGISTIQRTKYLEFEYNWRGKWGEAKGTKPLLQAVTMLDELDFTCYWAGRGKLWRITNCWLEHYSGVFWSNVACVNRVLAPDLAEQMETQFSARSVNMEEVDRLIQHGAANDAIHLSVVGGQCSTLQLNSINSTLPDNERLCTLSDRPWNRKCSIAQTTKSPDPSWLNQQTIRSEKFLGVLFRLSGPNGDTSIILASSEENATDNVLPSSPRFIAPIEGKSRQNTAQYLFASSKIPFKKTTKQAEIKFEGYSFKIVKDYITDRDFDLTLESYPNIKKEQIDVLDIRSSGKHDGIDFEMLKGSLNTLQRTAYVQFSTSWRGYWAGTEKPLWQSVNMLDALEFTCYWAGTNKLWRITGCWLEHYNGLFSSNVACVNRILAPELAHRMEAMFHETIAVQDK